MARMVPRWPHGQLLRVALMFVTPLDLRAYRPDEWVVLAPLRWESGGVVVTTPRGFITDLASIPRSLRGVLSVTGRSRKAAVTHDWGYCSQGMSRAETDELFRRCLISEGVSPAVARIYWAGVRCAGLMYWNRRASGVSAEDFAMRSDYERHISIAGVGTFREAEPA